MPRIRLFEVIGVIIILSLTAFAGISCVKAANADKLLDVTWVMKSYGDPGNLKDVLPDKEVTLTFDKAEGRISGNGGVNAYGGDYEADGSKLTVSSIYRTMIAGPEPLMSQETAFFDILLAAQKFTINDQELKITGKEGMVVLTKK
jgi:heat shock protein HslJ